MTRISDGVGRFLSEILVSAARPVRSGAAGTG
jgi:hypothetical protein